MSWPINNGEKVNVFLNTTNSFSARWPKSSCSFCGMCCKVCLCSLVWCCASFTSSNVTVTSWTSCYLNQAEGLGQERVWHSLGTGTRSKWQPQWVQGKVKWDKAREVMRTACIEPGAQAESVHRSHSQEEEFADFLHMPWFKQSLLPSPTPQYR